MTTNWQVFKNYNHNYFIKAKITLPIYILRQKKEFEEIKIFPDLRYDTINNGKSIYYDY